MPMPVLPLSLAFCCRTQILKFPTKSFVTIWELALILLITDTVMLFQAFQEPELMQDP